MVDLAVICEGKTERNFTEILLCPHFANFGISVSPIEIGIDCLQSGGNVTFARVLHDAELLLNSYKYVTTLVDFFRLGDGWRGLSLCRDGMSSMEKAEAVESTALEDALRQKPSLQLEHRFIVNVLMHEFEGLLFTGPEVIAKVTKARGAIDALKKISEEFNNPEDINSGRSSAPSKRLVSCKANYGKIAHGTRIAEEIGIDRIRSKCPHFNAWMTRIESLA